LIRVTGQFKSAIFSLAGSPQQQFEPWL
jgi:hypothetical protein